MRTVFRVIVKVECFWSPHFERNDCSLSATMGKSTPAVGKSIAKVQRWRPCLWELCSRSGNCILEAGPENIVRMQVSVVHITNKSPWAWGHVAASKTSKSYICCRPQGICSWSGGGVGWKCREHIEQRLDPGRGEVSLEHCSISPSIRGGGRQWKAIMLWLCQW